MQSHSFQHASLEEADRIMIQESDCHLIFSTIIVFLCKLYRPPHEWHPSNPQCYMLHYLSEKWTRITWQFRCANFTRLQIKRGNKCMMLERCRRILWVSRRPQPRMEKHFENKAFLMLLTNTVDHHSFWDEHWTANGKEPQKTSISIDCGDTTTRNGLLGYQDSHHWCEFVAINAASRFSWEMELHVDGSATECSFNVWCGNRAQ